MNRDYCTCVCFVLLTVLLEACSPDVPPTPPLKWLAYDVRFSIADQTVRLPIVAVDSSGDLCSEKDNPRYACFLSLEKVYAQKPIAVNVLHISLENYNYFLNGESHIVIPELCPMLSQEWASRICQSQNGGAKSFGLDIQRFTLVKEDYLKNYNSEWIEGGTESTGAMLQRMTFNDKAPSTYCELDKQGNPSSLCVVAMRIGDNLLAVWIITNERSVDKLAITQQAQGIRAFMQFGIGETENFIALNTALQ